MYYTGYPNYIKIAPSKYSVFIDDKIVYQGIAHLLPEETSLNLNVSSIVSQCIECPDYSSLFSNLQGLQLANLIYKVKIIDSTNKEFTMEYCWNYTGKNSTINELDVLSDYPTPWIYEWQHIPWTVCVNDNKEISAKLNKGSQTMPMFKFSALPADRNDIRTMMMQYVPPLILTQADETSSISLYYNNNIIENSTLEVRSCIDDNMYTVYYINSKGALSFVHCTCKNVLKNNMARNQFTQEPDYSNPAVHSSREYLIQRNKTWTLNTPFLNDKNSRLLQDLFYSPRVWVFSVKDRVYRSAVITDTAVEEKNTLNNRLFNYTINLKESQTYSIKA